MSTGTDNVRALPLGRRLLRLAIGLALLGAFIGTIMSGVTPPGVAGEVLRHNRAANIDASPLFYSDVEHMADLERAVAEMREDAKGGRVRPVCP